MRAARLRGLPGDCPLTWAVLGANALTFLVAFVSGGALWSALVFHSASVVREPWTILTYPLVAEGSILWLLIGGYIFWLFGGSLERAWGRDYPIFLALTTAATAIVLALGARLLGRGVTLAGLWMPLASSVVAWTAINPYERMLLYFVTPIQARWLGLVVAILVFFSIPFPLGLFALAGPALAWWFVHGGRFRLLAGGFRRTAPRRFAPEPLGPTLSPFRAVERWRQRRRFRRMMRDTGLERHHD